MAVAGQTGNSGLMFESLIDVVTASDWVYLLIVAIAALDALFPVVPSEATVIAAAALAGAGDLVLGLVLVAGAIGAVIGDNAAFLLGRAGQGPLLGRLTASAKWRPRISRAEEQLRRRSGAIITVSRFVPGGRTATMLAAGALGLSWRRFACYDLVAGILWATYASVLGWLGGRAFVDQPLNGLLLAFGIAAALAMLFEGTRRFRRGLAR
jgi:membrane protein DedA with SNARE-associated domain